MIYWGIQGGLYEDIDGIKAFFILRTAKHIIDKVIILKRIKRQVIKAPEQIDPTVLTEVPTGKVYGPEDMNGEPFKPEKLIEPEDM